MSYSFAVQVKDGALTVQSPHNVPDGKFSISGHEDSEWLSLSVTRHDADGKQAASATSYARH